MQIQTSQKRITIDQLDLFKNNLGAMIGQARSHYPVRAPTLDFKDVAVHDLVIAM